MFLERLFPRKEKQTNTPALLISYEIMSQQVPEEYVVYAIRIMEFDSEFHRLKIKLKATLLVGNRENIIQRIKVINSELLQTEYYPEINSLNIITTTRNSLIIEIKQTLDEITK
jgi:hypothetical protein